MPHAPGSAVPNWGLREAAAAEPEARMPAPSDVPAASVPAASVPAASVPAASVPAAARPAVMGAVAELGVPHGLGRIALDEARRVALRLFLLDNSGSTAAHDGHVLKTSGECPRLVGSTRWEEICGLAESAAALGAAVGVPCEFHLLNPLRTGTDIEGVDWIRTGDAGRSAASDASRLRDFLRKVSPGGVTPLAERLRSLRPRFDAFACAHAASGRVAFLVIATDGAPTPPNSGTPTKAAASAALAELRRLTTALPVRLVVRLCTDEDDAVSFWNGADAEEELPLDVLDDFEAEAKEVAGVGNGWLCYSPALHLLRESGTLVGLLDLLDERKLRPGEAATLAALVLGADELPDWQAEPKAFEVALRAKASAAPRTFDARRRRLSPQVDASRCLRAIHGHGLLGCGIFGLALCALVAAGLLSAALDDGAAAEVGYASSHLT